MMRALLERFGFGGETSTINPYETPRIIEEGEPIAQDQLPTLQQCCGTCEHWQQRMGIATVRACRYPLPDWSKERAQTHYEDGRFCPTYEQRTFRDYLDAYRDKQ